MRIIYINTYINWIFQIKTTVAQTAEILLCYFFLNREYLKLNFAYPNFISQVACKKVLFGNMVIYNVF